MLALTLACTAAGSCEPNKSDTAETVAETTSKSVVYYCAVKADTLYDYGEHFGPFDTRDEAVQKADELAVYGYRVFDSDGETVYCPYTELQSDILAEAKRITDYCRENKFTYGDAPINPAMNHDAKKVSCDRLVCWVMYNMGFTDQPQIQGVVVSAMEAWCDQQGFERIEKVDDLQPGDIVLVNPHPKGFPGHTFIYAGKTDKSGIYHRYDCGTNERIASVQPFSEAILNFMFAYRPIKAE